MADTISVQKRSKNMQRIKSKDTIPELILRSALHKMGYRFSLHRQGLPGKPDIVLPKYNTVIFVHGCFWHMHKKCRDGTLPKSHVKFWAEKLENNKKRDIRNIKELHNMGWKVLRFWECEIEKRLDKTLERFKKEITL